MQFSFKAVGAFVVKFAGGAVHRQGNFRMSGLFSRCQNGFQHLFVLGDFGGKTAFVAHGNHHALRLQ